MPGRTHIPALIAAAALALAASGVSAPQQPAAETCVVEGQVVRIGGGEPLRRARVSLAPVGRREAPLQMATDAGGRFRFHDVPPGRYRLVVERNGYLRAEFGQTAPGRPGTALELLPGQRRNDLLFRLVPWGVISGRVYDEEGDPVVRGTVTVHRSGFVRGRRQLSPVQTAPTNDRGEYRIFGLAPGRYYVSAQFSGSRPMVFTGTGGAERAIVEAEVAAAMAGRLPSDEGYAPTFYPGTTDAGRASPIELGPGDELSSLNFTLMPVTTVRVRGRVVNAATGQPPRGAMVFLFARDSGTRAMQGRSDGAVQGDSGEFEVRGVVPGAYYLAANWSDRGQLYTARQPLEVGAGGVDGVTLYLQHAATVEGVVRLEEASGMPEETMQVEGREVRVPALRVALIGADDSPAGISNTQVRADGRFSIRNIAPGQYFFSLISGTDRVYLKEVRLGGRDVLATGMEIGSQAALRLEVVVSGAGGRVEGMVLGADGLPAAGATVALVPEPHLWHLPHLFRQTTADSFGRFAFGVVAPGDYRAYAWEEIEPGAHTDPDLLRADEQRSRKLRVAERATSVIELTVIPADLRSW